MRDFKISLRIDLPNGLRFGPGKVALMGAIQAEGSIAAAARSLAISYPKASRLVSEINAGLKLPAIETELGGATRGGAHITPVGEALLAYYDSVCHAARDSLFEQEDQIAPLLAL